MQSSIKQEYISTALNKRHTRFDSGYRVHKFPQVSIRQTVLSIVTIASLCVLSAAAAIESIVVDPNTPGILEPALTAVDGVERRIPHTDQIVGAHFGNVVGDLVRSSALGSQSLLGQTIQRVNSPNADMRGSLKRIYRAAKHDLPDKMQAEATNLMDILMGTTVGRIYDGYSMLNFNRGKYVPDHVEGEYKMKRLRDTGLTEPGIDGQQVKIWEVDVSMFYYDGQIDSDTFLLRIPVEARRKDTFRVNYRIYSTVNEEFSPTVVMLDHKLPGSVQFPFKGFDSVWIPFSSGEVLEFTMVLPPLEHLRGVYTWGWREHPPRIQFLQPIFEIVNAHTGEVELDSQGLSYAYRNRTELTLDGIGSAAPEKKMYELASAILNGASTGSIEASMTRDDVGPRGTWEAWANLALNQLQLPPEALDVLRAEGIRDGRFGPYRSVAVYLNNEMYGQGPKGASIEGWNQGDRFSVKLINLDNHSHYFRNVDFGPRLHDEIAGVGSSGGHSFEIMNFKGTYGIPKVAEMQWRAGWGFRPHFDILQQQNVFSRPEDRKALKPFQGGLGTTYFGYQWAKATRGGDFRFNPPRFIITDTVNPAPQPLRDADGLPGLVIGQTTEGMGTAQFCPEDVPGFCSRNVAAFNPTGALNWPPHPLQGVNGLPNYPTELRFPPFLRNPAQGNPRAGDIIPPTDAWKSFWWINPNNGTLFNNAYDPSEGYWADQTYAHGTPIKPGESLNAMIESPRASGQLFYQFDDLFHDNAIFSPHASFGEDAIDIDDDVTID